MAILLFFKGCISRYSKLSSFHRRLLEIEAGIFRCPGRAIVSCVLRPADLQVLPCLLGNWVKYQNSQNILLFCVFAASCYISSTWTSHGTFMWHMDRRFQCWTFFKVQRQLPTILFVSNIRDLALEQHFQSTRTRFLGSGCEKEKKNLFIPLYVHKSSF